MRNRHLLTIAAALTLASPLLPPLTHRRPPRRSPTRTTSSPSSATPASTATTPTRRRATSTSTPTRRARRRGQRQGVRARRPRRSMLYKAITWAEEPNMPPKGTRSPRRTSIDQATGSPAAPARTQRLKVAINKPKANLAVVAVAGKPAGPVAMPRHLSIEPVVTPSARPALIAARRQPLGAADRRRRAAADPALQHPDARAARRPPVPRRHRLLAQVQPQRLAPARRRRASGPRPAGSSLSTSTTGNRVAEVGDEFDAVLAADISPDQTHVALGSPRKTLKISRPPTASRSTRSRSTPTGSRRCLQPRRPSSPPATAPAGLGLGSQDRQRAVQLRRPQGGRHRRLLPRRLQHPRQRQPGRHDQALEHDRRHDGQDDRQRPRRRRAQRSPSPTTAASSPAAATSSQALERPTARRIEAPRAVRRHRAARHVRPRRQRVIAGDFTGAIRVWNVADGKRSATSRPTRRPLAQQLAGFDQRLEDLQAAADKSTADLKSAQSRRRTGREERPPGQRRPGSRRRGPGTRAGQARRRDERSRGPRRAAREALAARTTAAEQATAAQDKAKSAAATAAANPRRSSATQGRPRRDAPPSPPPSRPARRPSPSPTTSPSRPR